MIQKSAFILMPFREELKDVYDFLIRDCLEKAGYQVNRADDIKSQSNILEDIIQGIATSDLIVADLTGANPNVYYELGISHALQKNVILMTQEINELPFDLRSYRVIAYSTHFAKMNQAKKELNELATEAYNQRLPFGNPVKDYNKSARPNYQTTQNPDNQTTEELGLLDHQIILEESFQELGELMTEVGHKLATEISPITVSSTTKLTTGTQSSREKKIVIQEMADQIQKYGAFLKPKNGRYRELLKGIETSLEEVLNTSINLEPEPAKDGILSFIEMLSGLENSAEDGKAGFLSLIKTMESIPKIEQSFNRANVFMVSELKSLVENIDQTIAVVSRAKRLGKNLAR